MEFVQFHPTGMVWPPSVKGILVTEGVRGEGGVLRNKDGKRFMFDDIPENYRSSTADNEEEGWRYTQGDKSARRPPELLTRDHVARCINREVKAGRGSPHGGVFLDIAWIKEKIPNSVEHIKKKLPSMYHQFKQLADLDITKEPMEVGPTTHYIMGGIQVDAETQMSPSPGYSRPANALPDCTERIAWAGIRSPILLVFGKRAGEYAAKFAKEHGAGKIDQGQVDAAAKAALAPFERGAAGENPFAVQNELQEFMQDLVGIVRMENEMQQALEKIKGLRARAAKAGITGNHRIQHRVAHRARSRQHAGDFRDHRDGGDRAQGKPRRAFPRRLSRQERRLGQVQSAHQQGRGRTAAAGTRSGRSAHRRNEAGH